mgnify:CR=1 FL=1
MAIVLDGKKLSLKSEKDFSKRVEKIKAKNHSTPILATILVGSDPASATYVKMKGNACKRVGMDSMKIELDEATTTSELIKKIEELNSNENVLILDEPFVGLDKNSKEFLKNFMEAEVKKNKTIIFTSHIDFKDDYREIKING